jgi:hypothetical protein
VPHTCHNLAISLSPRRQIPEDLQNSNHARFRVHFRRDPDAADWQTPSAGAGIVMRCNPRRINALQKGNLAPSNIDLTEGGYDAWKGQTDTKTCAEEAAKHGELGFFCSKWAHVTGPKFLLQTEHSFHPAKARPWRDPLNTRTYKIWQAYCFTSTY